jgi:hypothetical protein
VRHTCAEPAAAAAADPVLEEACRGGAAAQRAQLHHREARWVQPAAIADSDQCMLVCGAGLRQHVGSGLTSAAS